ncbi:ABC transporter permease [Streptomyces sp. PTM05]|uniref:ABC transporter permease n=1 Tax=Streptantibioticus parmotrematis TaxID=2873249 RepID=A0ABS7QMH1_9ACTN|nr:ABC transporter permease [Streptantibioticus parmotrematis]MBY8884133.1 ABC transporter permease [Streptantibioticus parmotrematis]
MTSARETTTTGSDNETDAALARAASGTVPVGRSPRQLAWIRFRRDRTGVVCAVIVACFILIALAAPLITKAYGKNPYTLYGQDDGLLNSYGLPLKPNGGIDGAHWFGVEPGLGRDVLALLVYGIRTSLGIALCVTVLSVVAGVTVGLFQGYLGGRTDYVVGRFSDLMMSFPQQLFFIAFTPVIVAMFVRPGNAEPTWIRFAALVIVQFVLGWMALGRLVRAQVLSLRTREYVEAARLSGASTARIVRRELLPNIWSTVLVQSTLLLPVNVTAEAGLSYLGVGMQTPTPDWGLMFQDAAQYYQSDITYMFFPGVAMVVFVVAFNLLGDSVRDALDPKTVR